jgi:hypothetical protein
MLYIIITGGTIMNATKEAQKLFWSEFIAYLENASITFKIPKNLKYNHLGVNKDTKPPINPWFSFFVNKNNKKIIACALNVDCDTFHQLKEKQLEIESRFQFKNSLENIGFYWNDKLKNGKKTIYRIEYHAKGDYKKKKEHQLIFEWFLEILLIYLNVFEDEPYNVMNNLFDSGSIPFKRRNRHCQNDNRKTKTNGKTAKKLLEGGEHSHEAKIFERNSLARKMCIKHYGYICQACEDDLTDKYGPLADEFIHVHHLEQISNQCGEYEINPTDDLNPVCPNCHAMLHRKSPPLSIDELKNIISKSRGSI